MRKNFRNLAVIASLTLICATPATSLMAASPRTPVYGYKIEGGEVVVGVSQLGRTEFVTPQISPSRKFKKRVHTERDQYTTAVIPIDIMQKGTSYVRVKTRGHRWSRTIKIRSKHTSIG